ncbi:DMT family transporter [Leeuwenhoekiella sp. A16]|uniref:DMT family transporter n=1 Tax=unclassified Leeuwenhoekiella TaxID=2615029 RepID=UPI003A7FFC79
MNPRLLALIAATVASAIYGVNHTIAKDLMPYHIKPFGFILLRVSGAALLFWIISAFYKSEKVDKQDYFRFLGCAFFGMCINMLAFFKGLSLSTPINSSVVVTMTPVILLVLSVIFLRERVSWVKVLGIGLGFIGALVLILFGAQHQKNAPNIPFGNLLLLVNASAYGVYLILVKPLVAKYNTITMMKWFFLLGVLMNLPVSFGEFAEVHWATLSFDVIWKMGFVIVGTTFMTYLLNLYALKTLKTSTLGAFIYLQPVIAALFAIFVGADRLTPIRMMAALLIFTGVYLSTRTKPLPD